MIIYLYGVKSVIAPIIGAKMHEFNPDTVDITVIVLLGRIPYISSEQSSSPSASQPAALE